MILSATQLCVCVGGWVEFDLHDLFFASCLASPWETLIPMPALKEH